MKSVFKKIVVSILTAEAKLLLNRTKPKIIAITGSVGKTTTKDAIYHVLKDHVRARKSEKSFNSDIGVPLSVLGLSNGWSNPFLWLKNLVDGFMLAAFPHKYPEVLVLEMGVDRPGDMALLTDWIKPDVVVLTRLPRVPVHVEYFDTPEAVIAEKMKLVEALKPDGILVYNHDDEEVLKVAEGVRQQAIGYSRYSPSQFFASADQIYYQDSLPAGVEFTVKHIDEEVTVRFMGALGVQNTHSVTAACAVASIFDISLDEASKALDSFVPPAGRMRVIPGIKNTLIIDDTYNSSPVAAERALSSLFELDSFNRKIAVLGDMLELGRYSVSEHEKVGEQAAEGCDVIFTVGVRAQAIARQALSFGFSEKNLYQFDDVEKAGKELQSLMAEGDVILVKGSQGMRMERIVKEVMAEPGKAPELLVRQSEVWQKKL